MKKVVWSDTVKDDNILLAALKGINSVDLDITQLGVYRFKPRPECVFQRLDLGRVGRDYRNLANQRLEGMLMPADLLDALNEW